SLARAAAHRPSPVFDWGHNRRMTDARDDKLEARAAQSLGESSDAIYESAAAALRRRGARGTIVDVGCGAGRLRTRLTGMMDRYVGVAAVRYEGFPAAAPV